MLSRIIDLTHYIEEGSMDRVAAHLDWAAKLLYLMQCDGPFGDATMRVADHDFTNTDPARGTIWRLWEDGLVDPLVTIDDAKSCLHTPPPESRDWCRGRLIDRFAEHIAAIDWSYVEVYRNGPWFGPRKKKINLPQLDSLNRTQFQHMIDSADTMEDLLDRLEGEASPAAAVLGN